MRQSYQNVVKALLFVALAAFVIYLFPRYNYTFRYAVEVGKPWPYETLTAEFDFPIYKTDAQLEEERQALLKGFTPCFSLTDNNNGLLILSLQDSERLRQYGCEKVAVRNGRHSTTHAVNELYTPRTAYQTFGHEFQPNLQFDSITSRQIQDNLLSQLSLTQGLIQAGERIIERGEIVSENDAQILYSLRRAYEDEDMSRRQRIFSVCGDTALVILFLLLFLLYLYVFRPALFDDLRTMCFFALLVAITITMACVTLRYTRLSIYLIPFAWVPIITRVFYDARTALFLHLATVFITSLAVPAPFEFLIIQTAVGMVAVASLKDLTARAQLVQTAAWLFLTYAIAYTAFTLATTGDWHTIQPYTYLYFLANTVLIICSYGLIYLFEKAFRLISSITLVELADINSELMHQFADKAPGTFQHSMQVSNLATEAAKRIGANSLLVRTGALYHDIGKITRPECFTENQQDGQNPLLDMAPEEAAKIVIGHVAEGEHLARQHHLPEVITNFVTTHHGTSLTRYFYNTWVNLHPGETPDVSLFRYPGPKPTTREAAILMMADAVEARSHSLAEYTEQAISDMVNSMIDQQVADGQLSETPLSFRDLEDVKKTFTARIIAINHRRIKYPEIQK